MAEYSALAPSDWIHYTDNSAGIVGHKEARHKNTWGDNLGFFFNAYNTYIEIKCPSVLKKISSPPDLS